MHQGEGFGQVTSYRPKAPHSVNNARPTDELNDFRSDPPPSPPQQGLRPLHTLPPQRSPPACADQLSPAFTAIFNTSLETCHVPARFKTSTIIPIPKKPRIRGLYLTDPLLDPLKFTYRANRSVNDTVMALHYILQHLDSAGNYIRILIVEFSSAFYTITARYKSKHTLDFPRIKCQA
ncbi:hypothetical protein D4764_21G0004410 [Takifugu flavidus]|uniref:Uncharacterized protein n=1 Tax=Takifugu flavidus TaxID=433684 RepID=A0A5C6NG06_9TELE|nr:hypothetical protein D4764_21G0004410 [Takifugu flavidus]